MKKYIVFYTETLEKDLVECVGTGSIIAPDQRYSIYTIINKVFNKEFPIPKEAVGFNIQRGDNLFDLTEVSKFYKINRNA